MKRIIDEFSDIPNSRLRFQAREKAKRLRGEKTCYDKWKDKLSPERALEVRRNRNTENRDRDPEGYLFYEAKARAKENNLEFTLEKSDIILPERCPILNIPLFKNKGKRGPSDNSWTVDRFDNDKGYTKENIRVISWRANRLKNNATLEELEALINYMKN